MVILQEIFVARRSFYRSIAGSYRKIRKARNVEVAKEQGGQSRGRPRATSKIGFKSLPPIIALVRGGWAVGVVGCGLWLWRVRVQVGMVLSKKFCNPYAIDQLGTRNPIRGG